MAYLLPKWFQMSCQNKEKTYLRFFYWQGSLSRSFFCLLICLFCFALIVIPLCLSVFSLSFMKMTYLEERWCYGVLGICWNKLFFFFSKENTFFFWKSRGSNLFVICLKLCVLVINVRSRSTLTTKNLKINISA